MEAQNYISRRAVPLRIGNAMFVPQPPAVRAIERITPTLYDALLKCEARGAWIASETLDRVPPHPRALLGIAAHAVVERARTGRLDGESAEDRLEFAAALFDTRMAELFSKTTPLLRVKFPAPERLPFYYLYRARASQLAAELTPRRLSPETRAMHDAAHRPKVAIEGPLLSSDGRVAGRPDVLDSVRMQVVDSKFGIPANPKELSTSEARQLRLYAFLAQENGVPVRTGVIERGDRTKLQLPISREEAINEGKQAIAALDAFNKNAGKHFDELASPSPENCRFCPCIAFCERFWSTSEPIWSATCGTHIEGVIDSVGEGEELVSIHLDVRRGTGPHGRGVITRLSRDWLTFDGTPMPASGQSIRVVDATVVPEAKDPAVFTGDKVATAVWMLAPD
ncbi:MAG: PD-(D/E)XK nuclease family protein [Terracidiphilus sp.]